MRLAFVHFRNFSFSALCPCQMHHKRSSMPYFVQPNLGLHSCLRYKRTNLALVSSENRPHFPAELWPGTTAINSFLYDRWFPPGCGFLIRSVINSAALVVLTARAFAGLFSFNAPS